MYSDGSAFMRRAQLFHAELRKGAYPNAASLAKLAGCSKNTAQRTIDRLRQEFGMPCEYDRQEHGYRLTNKYFQMPLLNPAKDELIALLLMRELSNVLDDAEISEKLENLWVRYKGAAPNLALELDKVATVFSSDSTVIAELSDTGVFEFLAAATDKAQVMIRYQSPWRHNAPEEYRGIIRKVSHSDGTLYLHFKEFEGREIVLNASFVLGLIVLPATEQIKLPIGDATEIKEKDSFGIWEGESVNALLKIAPPASRYYARQKWHESQNDSWDGETLVRTLKTPISPEIIRRILSLGRFVEAVEPVSLREAVGREAACLSEALKN